MKALILATGDSLKLSPLTNKLPSPLLPVAGKPIMSYTIEQLAHAGINEIVICIQHMGGQIESWFGNGRRWGVHLEYSLQRDALGNAGSVKWARGFLNEPFLVIKGDTYQALDMPALIESHQSSNCIATSILCHESRESRAAGVSQPLECYLFQPEVLDYIPERQFFDIQSDLLPVLAQANQPVNTFNHTGYWSLLDTFQELQRAQVNFINALSGQMGKDELTFLNLPTIKGNKFGPTVWAGKNNIIHPSVRIFPPVIIGDNCQIGKDVELGPYTVVGSNSIIDDDASIRHSTVTEKTYIGKVVNVENKIITSNLIIDVPTGQSTYITDPFLISSASPPVINSGFRLIFDKAIALIMLLMLSPLVVFMCIVTFLGTGRIFRDVERIGVIPSDIISGAVISPSRIKLKHFNTVKKNGNPSFLTKWIRMTGLYRIPELFGVMSGQLSLIGVKPLSLDEADQLNEDWQFQRYSFSAGFTGLWYTEQSNSNRVTSALIYDVYYVAMRSFYEDCRILLKTVPRWVKNLLFS